jgi:TonB family protein
VYVVLDGSSNGGVLYDVGEGGLAVDIVGPKLTGEQVLLEFDMAETGRHFEATGQITWKNEPENRVGLRFMDLSEASNLQIKEWLCAKSISGEFNNAEFQDLSIETGPPEHPAPQGEKTTEPVALRWFEPVAKTQPPDPIYTDRPTPVPSDSVPIAPQGPANGAPAQDDGDRVVRELRSALSQSEAARRARLYDEITPEQAALDRQRRRKWILVAVLVVEVLVLAVGTWFYTSQDWNIGAAFERVKAIVASAFFSSTTVPPPAPISHPSIPKAGRSPHEESKSQGSKQTTSSADAEPGEGNKTPATSQFEVLDAQNGRWLLPRTSTSVSVQFERPGTSESKNTSGNEPRLTASAPPEPASAPLRNARGSELGHVSQQSSGELPTTQVMPEYPTLALQKNVQGRVVLKAVISKDGTLQNFRLVSPPSLLNSTVLEAVRKWRYQPHYENGEPVEVETQITVDFSITAKSGSFP